MYIYVQMYPCSGHAKSTYYSDLDVCVFSKLISGFNSATIISVIYMQHCQISCRVYLVQLPEPDLLQK